LAVLIFPGKWTGQVDWFSNMAAEWVETSQAKYVACACTAVSVLISAAHIIQHLTHFTAPHIQSEHFKFSDVLCLYLYCVWCLGNVVRIILICPVYAISSVIALSLGHNGLYAEIFRDLYEAFVVYCFMYLMLEYCGGETDCVYMMENEPALRFPFPFSCIRWPRNAR
jgi:hypothetical protein